jgi:hypothetical protein
VLAEAHKSKTVKAQGLTVVVYLTPEVAIGAHPNTAFVFGTARPWEAFEKVTDE